ncbi:response regulator transcription factor [Erwinia aphidicola]|nr:response regulator transcription factor [Erwinia aphidicola]
MLEMLLTRENIAVVGKASNGAETIELMQQLRPDLLVIDIVMPVLNGLEVITQLHKLRLPVKILVFTGMDAQSFGSRCRQAGAAGFVQKAENHHELLAAVRAVLSGYTYYPAEEYIAGNHLLPTEALTTEEKLASLTGREMMVLVHLARGFSNIEIAKILNLSNKTISTYKTRLLKKLGMKNLVDLIDVAIRQHLI